MPDNVAFHEQSLQMRETEAFMTDTESYVSGSRRAQLIGPQNSQQKREFKRKDQIELETAKLKITALHITIHKSSKPDR